MDVLEKRGAKLDANGISIVQNNDDVRVVFAAIDDYNGTFDCCFLKLLESGSV